MGLSDAREYYAEGQLNVDLVAEGRCVERAYFAEDGTLLYLNGKRK